ncbi:NUDIX domain-containing protein [Candidatus Wolfebacteria bacterium]|nr:NUDIX domain-containing protein [Candidatus Wolfebacteria bacterium]
MSRQISAGFIVYRKTEQGPRFLILYHGRGYWNFPKGKIESEEKSFQTAIRELREETGLGRQDLKVIERFKAYEKFVFWVKTEKIFKIVIFYLAETKKKGVKISEIEEGQPHEGFGWFTYREALKILSKHKDSQRVLKQAYDFLQRKGVKRRSQNSARKSSDLQTSR